MSTDDAPSPDHENEVVDEHADLEDPATPRHLSSGEELQDPDAELSEALHVDTLAVENFRNPMRLN